VKPQVLWRGSQPDEAEFGWLIGQGVKTVVDLELLHDDAKRIQQAPVTTATETRVAYFRVRDWEPLPALAPSVTDEHVVHFLAIASQQPHQPIYVHCRSGQNRTGVMAGAFRIVLEGEDDVDKVIAEMKSYGGRWAAIDARYLRSLRARREEILKRVALKATTLEPPVTFVCREGKCAPGEQASPP
jgi:protein tyrosine phosphatase (PTP) superfamily phosphohydrolase (DUF442 family)